MGGYSFPQMTTRWTEIQHSIGKTTELSTYVGTCNHGKSKQHYVMNGYILLCMMTGEWRFTALEAK